MNGPAVRPPLPVVLRRFWRRMFRSQSAGFKFTAAMSAAVLAAGVGTAVVGVGSGTSTLRTAQGPGANGTGANGGPSTAASTKAQQGSGSGSSSGKGSGGTQGSGTSNKGTKGPAGCQNPAGSTDHGVTASTIDVVLPVANLSGFQAALATASPSNSSEDEGKAIHAYVDYVNKHGGINCRQIHAITPEFNPGDEDGSMRPLCQKYTKDHPVFAWINGIPTWHDSNQLCVTQEGHTPLISSWTTVTDMTRTGAPNLWWAGPDLCYVLRNLVHWAVANGKLTKSTKFGVVYSTSSADKDGYNKCLRPALSKAGLTPRDTGQLHYSTTPDQSASQAGVIASRFHSEGITVVIPMLPFFQFESWISGERAQGWAPKMLLSDYDQMFLVALSLVGESGSGNRPFPTPYTNQLQDQEGPSYFVLGNADSPPYASSLGKYCDDVWHKYYPPTAETPHIEATGTAMMTCQNVQLFVQAATAAGDKLTRAGFDAQMARLTNVAGGVVPNMRFGPGLYAGPHMQRIVKVHNNTDDACPTKHNQKQGTYNQGNCWLISSAWSEQVLAPI